MDTTLSLVLIEDNRLLRDGIAALIRHQSGFPILAASADVTEALEKIREAHPDVVLLDGSESHEGLRLAATIHDEVPDVKVVVMGVSLPDVDIAGFVAVGVAGFLTKDATFEEFVTTIRAVVDGNSVLPAPLVGALFAQIARQWPLVEQEPAAETARLTQRERQVIHLIGEGLSNKEIAVRLQIAVYTVKSHVHNVLEKLALHSRLELATLTYLVETRDFDRKHGSTRRTD